MDDMVKEKVKRYVKNLNEDGLRQALTQCLLYEDSRKYLFNCALEFDKIYPRFTISDIENS